MIAIVDYGVGNLFSLQCSLRYMDIDCVVTGDAAVIRGAEQVIFPGVGAFGDAAAKLRASGLDGVVVEQANVGKPLLGICVGMQLLYESSCEYGVHQGLGLIPGSIRSLREDLGGEPLKVPHMGWNELEAKASCSLLPREDVPVYVYYVHSFYAPVTADTVASSWYGGVELTGVVQRGNVFGTQFHPEKSGKDGLNLLKAFSQLKG